MLDVFDVIVIHTRLAELVVYIKSQSVIRETVIVFISTPTRLGSGFIRA